MFPHFQTFVRLAACCVVLSGSSISRADDSRTSIEKIGRVGSDAIGPFVVAGEAALLFSADHGGQRALRGAEALLTTTAATEVLKLLSHEKRPNGAGYKSFPSGHASAAFTTATLLDAYRPGLKGAGYGMATFISLSRVAVHAHYFHDIVAGALLGHFITRQFTQKYRAGGDDFGGTNSLAANTASFHAPGAFPLENHFAGPSFGDSKWHLGLNGGLALSKSW